LQEAFAKALARRQGPTVRRWCRGSTAPSQRRHRPLPPPGAADRGLEAFAPELETVEMVPERPGDEVCQCISRLATTLKPDYAEALQAIEVEGSR
jgi:RNA polymerase sigma-70 factor (ECF subfamily)